MLYSSLFVLYVFTTYIIKNHVQSKGNVGQLGEIMEFIIERSKLSVELG